MGKLFESLRRPSDRRDTPTPAAWAPPVPLKVLPPSAEPLAPRDLWPPLSEGEAAPFVEVPEALSPAATETEASAAVVPFTPAPEAESETETARSGYAWRPAALSLEVPAATCCGGLVWHR